MNFNGKYWHKAGHLGMTTAQVKEALAGAGKIPEIEAGDAGKAIVVNEAEDGYELASAGGGSLYQHNIVFIETGNNPLRISFSIITANDTPFATRDEIINFLQGKGFPSTGNSNQVYPASGSYVESVAGGGKKVGIVFGINALTNVLDIVLSPLLTFDSTGVLTSVGASSGSHIAPSAVTYDTVIAL